MLFLNLQKYQRAKLFSCVTNTREMISVCLSALEYLQYWGGNNVAKRPYLCLDNEYTHRLYLVDVDKIITFGFDLNVVVANPKLDDPKNFIKGIFFRQYPITAREISEARQLLSNNMDPQYLYCYNMLEDDASVLESSIYLFEHLVFFEWGYVRFDYDPSHARGRKHPASHLDVNFTRAISYKLGLKTKIDFDALNSIIRSDTDCAELDLP